jgi:ABC-type transporter Mla subunit MlaD
MSFEITLTLKDILWFFIGLGAIVLLIYLIVLFKNLLQTVKKTNLILDDANVVTKITASRATEVNEAVSDLSGALGSVANSFKGNQSTMAAFSNLVNALASLKGLLKNK